MNRYEIKDYFNSWLEYKRDTLCPNFTVSNETINDQSEVIYILLENGCDIDIVLKKWFYLIIRLNKPDDRNNPKTPKNLNWTEECFTKYLINNMDEFGNVDRDAVFKDGLWEKSIKHQKDIEDEE